MNEKHITKSKIIVVRIEEGDYDQLINRQKSTTERSLSAYCRKQLLGKPMIKAVQNESLREVLQHLSLLQKDLNGIGNNYNQMVKRLHITDRIPEVRQWFLGYLSEKQRIQEAIQSVKMYLDKTAQKWLQE